jgi:mercuric ion transport protein
MTATSSRAKKFSIGGAILTALAASSCCIGPLVLAAMGVGGAGATAALGAYRPYFLGATAALLLAGFYLTYRKPRATAAECACERPRASRAGRIALWISTVAVVLVAASPPLLARWADARGLDANAATDPRLAHATIAVNGIDCEACASPMRKALARVGGFRDLSIDMSKHTVFVSYEPAPGRLEAYVAAINDLGYEATLPTGGQARR